MWPPLLDHTLVVVGVTCEELSLCCVPLPIHLLYNLTILNSHTSFLPSFLESVTAKDMQTFHNEIAILKKLSMNGNPHVITMVGYIARENPPAIVMEFAPLGSLHDFLVKVKEEVRVNAVRHASAYAFHSVLLISSLLLTVEWYFSILSAIRMSICVNYIPDASSNSKNKKYELIFIEHIILPVIMYTATWDCMCMRDLDGRS